MEETLRCRRTLRSTARVVGNGQEPAVVFAVGDALGDALVRPGKVVARIAKAQVSEPIGYSGGTGELDLMCI
jgi:hypothetical protein